MIRTSRNTFALLAISTGFCLANCAVEVKDSDDSNKVKGGQAGAVGNTGTTTLASGGAQLTAGGAPVIAAGATSLDNTAGALNVAGASAQGCGAISEAGLCSGDVLTYCKDGALLSLDCATVGAICKTSNGVSSCEQSSRAPSCGDLTALGTCVEAKMQYCDLTGMVGVPRTVDCAAYGQRCNPTAGADGGAMCVPQGPCPSDVTEGGVCSGNQLRFCDGGNLFQFDCGLDECKSVGGFSDCFMPTVTTGCGTETPIGRCDGQTRVVCPGNTVLKEDCAAIGLTCTATASGAACQRATACPATCPNGYSCKSGLCSPDTTPTREWTIAVYMVGNNNLSDSGWDDLNEIETVGSSNSYAVVSEAEFSEKYSRSVPEEYQTGTYRLLLNQDTDPQLVSSLGSAQALSATNMSEAASLSSFLKWSAEKYPAKRLALVLWDHGMGYQGGFLDGSSDYLTLKEIVSGIKDSGVHPDLVAFDACLMGMHEVAMSLRGVADWMVGSEEIEPGSGYPYDRILGHLQETPTLTPQQLGSAIVDEYGAVSALSTRIEGATQSLVDLSKVAAFNDELGKLGESISANLSQQRLEVRGAFGSENVLRFRLQDNADVSTAMSALGGVEGSIGTTATAVGTAFTSSGLVARNAAVGKSATAAGLAFFFPQVGFTALTLDEYRQETSFLPLQAWHAALSSLQKNESTNTVTPGTGAVDSFSVILTWGSTPDGKTANTDLDLYVYEPNGDFAVPVNGSVSPNGVLSGDSYDTGVARESYELSPQHEPGTYIVLVHFYDGPPAGSANANEIAYPRLQLFRSDLPGGSRTYLRGKIANRTLTEFPMSNQAPLTTTIDQSNFAKVQNLDYSNIWYAFTVEVY